MHRHESRAPKVNHNGIVEQIVVICIHHSAPQCTERCFTAVLFLASSAESASNLCQPTRFNRIKFRLNDRSLLMQSADCICELQRVLVQEGLSRITNVAPTELIVTVQLDLKSVHNSRGKITMACFFWILEKIN